MNSVVKLVLAWVIGHLLQAIYTVVEKVMKGACIATVAVGEKAYLGPNTEKN